MTCTQVAGEIHKTPTEVLDFSVEWTLPTGDSLTTSACTTSTGTVVVDSVQRVSDTVTVWVSGGACGETAELVMTVGTTLGRTLQRSIFVKVAR